MRVTVRQRARIMRSWSVKLGACAVLHPLLVEGAPLPTTLPTDTTSVSFGANGYSGTIPTEFGKLTKMSSNFLLNSNKVHPPCPPSTRSTPP